MVYDSPEKEIIRQHIDRVKELVCTVRHVPIATVNRNGSPHNTPVFAAFDTDMTMYWASSPGSVHSKNIARTGQVFTVVFDSMEKGGGLYIQAEAAETAGAEKVQQALAVINKKLSGLSRAGMTLEKVTGKASQRLYRAVAVRLWVNMAVRHAKGDIVEDKRYEVTIKDLLQ